MTELRGQEAWHLALLQAWGQHEEARHYLEQLNRIQRAFGREPYSMPAPASVGLPDLVTCPAVSDVLGEQLTETMPDPFGDAFGPRCDPFGAQPPAASSCQHRIAIARKSA